MAVGIAAIAAIAIGGALLPAPAPAAGSPASYGMVDIGTVVRVVGSTVAVVALLIVSLRLLKRAGLGSTPRGAAHLRLLETLPLGERRVLYIVAIGERRLIIGASPTGMSAIGEAGADEIAADPTSHEEVPVDFIEQLHAAAERRR
jgi:flagellar biogenesis protein FliO